MDSLRRHLVAALTLSLLLALPAAASAAGWLTPVAIQPASTAPSGTSQATTASNPAGAQAFTWNDNTTNIDGGAVCLHGEVVSRASGGDLSPSKETGCNVVLAVGPGDQVVAAWITSNVIYAATGTAGQQLSDPVAVSSVASGLKMFFPVIRFDPSGTPTIAWGEERSTAPAYAVRTATRQPDGSWSVSGQVGFSDAVNPTPDLAFGPSGDAVLAFNSTSSGNYYVQTLYRANNSASWSGPSPVYGPLSTSSGAFEVGPRVRFDPQGRAVVIEPVLTSLSPRSELFTWTRATNGTWTQQNVPNSVNTTAQAALPYADMEFDSAGNGVIAFRYGVTNPANSFNVRVATRAPGVNAWSTGLAELEPSNFAYLPSTPDVAFDSHDNATIAYSYNKTLRVFTRPAGASAFSLQSLPPGVSGTNPAITSDANGYLIATWTDANGVTNTSVYDPVPPTVDTVDVPTDGVTGTPVTFTVGGSDVWGPVSYSIDFGDGEPAATGRVAAKRLFAVLARASGGGTVSHTYSQPGIYTATISVTDGAANTATATRAVTVAQATSPQVTLPPVPGLPDPIVGATVNLATVKPVVLVKEPGSKKFVTLVTPKQVRIGSIVDARKGRVRITIADGRGKLWTADFYGGVFRIRQLTKPGSFAVMQLYGGKFKGCPRAPKPVLFARKKRSPSRSVRHLWSSGSGPFRTVGRFASATIRGTTWLTDDRCNATLVRVTKGKIAVRDFVRRKTVVVKAPKRYLARPRRR